MFSKDVPPALRAALSLLIGVLVWGCSDGNGSVNPPTATLTPSATASPSPTPTATLVPLSPTEDVTVALENGGGALLVTPATSLRGRSVYGLLLTNGIADGMGNSLQASPSFKRLKGTSEPDGGGPVALFDDDVDAAGNPYPDPRLVRPDGTVRVPDRFALRGLPDVPPLAAARQFLRTDADDLGTIAGFSTTAPIRIALSAPVDPATVRADTLFLFERDDGALDLAGLLQQAARRGIRAENVALGVSFPTQPIEDDLRAIRSRLLARAAAEPFHAILDDPDPADDLHIGVFAPGSPDFPQALAGNTDVRVVAFGLIRSPDFRGADGVFDPAKVSGIAETEDALVDFVLVLPTGGVVPPRIVILQHGFGGSNLSMLPIAGALASEGLASIAISAVDHGRRGAPTALLTSRPIQVRDIFRQTIADQMALVRALEAGVDLDADGQPDIDTSEIDYLGRSLGSILGATFVAVEDRIHAAVLNVGGGRVAFLGQAPAVRPIYSAYYAQTVGLDMDSPEFAVFIDRLLELGQEALDPADGLNFARHWSLDLLPGALPRRILMQEGIGDQWVSNDSTDALAAAGGLIANVVMQDPQGVSGLWRFDPPGGHNILDRPDVLQQALQFLESGGTEITADD